MEAGDRHSHRYYVLTFLSTDCIKMIRRSVVQHFGKVVFQAYLLHTWTAFAERRNYSNNQKHEIRQMHLRTRKLCMHVLYLISTEISCSGQYNLMLNAVFILGTGYFNSLHAG